MSTRPSSLTRSSTFPEPSADTTPRSEPRIRISTGTSGFAYKQWKGAFYPDDITAAGMLRYYAQRLTTVEINNTFYRMPRPGVIQQWAEQVPAGFQFILKAPRSITHFRRLNNSTEPLGWLLDGSAPLAAARGPFLFQLPPNMKADVERLKVFLALLPADTRAAFEFRHPSWHDEAVFQALRDHGTAMCIADTDDDATPVIPTADWGYVRLRRNEYSEAQLTEWALRIRATGWTHAFVFFKHEDAGAGPLMAERFRLMFADN